MRKAVAALAISFFTLLPIASNAALKPGDICKKVGITAISSGKKYTCIKSGKKFIWSQGVLIKKNPSASNSNNQTSPSPIQSASPSPSPTPTQSAKPLTKYEELLRGDGVTSNALRRFDEYPKQKVQIDSPFDWVFGSNSLKSYQDFIKSSLNLSLEYFADFFVDQRKFPVVYATEDQFDWFMDYLDNNKIVSPWLRDEYKARIQREGKQVNIGSSDVWGDNLNQINILRGRDRTWGGDADFAFLPHEFTHALQNSLSGAQANIPCWSAEGAAQFFGSAISAKYNNGDYVNMRYWSLRMVREAPQNLDPWKYTDAQWLDAFKRLEKRGDLCSFDARISYGIGINMTELMLSDKGVNTLMEWWRTAKSSEGWRSGFERLYGTPIDKWYSEVALPYVKKIYSENNY